MTYLIEHVSIVLQLNFILKICIIFETSQLICNTDKLTGFHIKEIITIAGKNHSFSFCIIIF